MNTIDVDAYHLQPTKHFMLMYMCRWGWDFHDLREALRHAHSVEQVGVNKYEAYVRKKGSKKMIFVIEGKMIRVISGSVGGK